MQAADNPEGDGALQAIGSAQGNRPVAHLQGFGIAKGGGPQLSHGLDSHHGQIGDRIGAQHAAIHLLAIGQGHLNPVDTIDHMGIGEHQPLAINHHTGALAPLPRAGGGIAEQLPQQGIAEGRIQAPGGHVALRIDPHHRGRHPLDRLSHKAAGLGQRGLGRRDSSRDGG